ncbi:agmatine deiminase family protein, partial [Francisella tularensis subsp. holarctica]
MVVNQPQLDSAKNYLVKNIPLIRDVVDDSWARYIMPIFSFKADKLIANNYDFNCWSNKFSPFDHDRRLKNDIAKLQKWQVNSSQLMLV